MVEAAMRKTFSPDWRTHPGEHLEEHLDARGWSQADFARRAGMTPKLVSEIVNAKNPVTPETAIRFQRVLGLNAEVWMNLQSKWDLHQLRLKEESEKQQLASWLKAFPVKELQQRGAIPIENDVRRLADALCQFLGIGSPSAFPGLVKSMAVQHRRGSGDAKEEHVCAWLLLGEREASKLQLPRYSKDLFLKATKKIRGLTSVSPEVFVPEMVALCQSAGVAIVFEPPISKTSLFGSARWFNGGRNALIQLSLRMKTNDHLWWTFFHECGHIILHEGKNFADDKNAHGDGPEHEADRWAEQLLYGDDGVQSVIDMLDGATEAEVKRLAGTLKLHAGIIVGMLQHYRVIDFSKLNHLKARYDWAN